MSDTVSDNLAAGARRQPSSELFNGRLQCFGAVTVMQGGREGGWDSGGEEGMGDINGNWIKE